MVFMKAQLTILYLFLFSGTAFAAIHSESIEYKHGDAVLEGYLAYDDVNQQQRPGILVVHEWKGLGSYAKKRVQQLAELGYIAFAVDMYGKGVRPKTNEEAGVEAGKYKNDRARMRARISAGLGVLKNNPLTDTNRIAAIGYCFGGTTVLELARSGADLKGVVSFHGGLSTPTPEDAKNIKAKVLVLAGADDPYVPQDEVLAFQEEMRQGHVDWQMMSYGGSVHSFTNPDAGNDPSQGAAYNEKADQRSWQAMRQFFEEIFK